MGFYCIVLIASSSVTLFYFHYFLFFLNSLRLSSSAFLSINNDSIIITGILLPSLITLDSQQPRNHMEFYSQFLIIYSRDNCSNTNNNNNNNNNNEMIVLFLFIHSLLYSLFLHLLLVCLITVHPWQYKWSWTEWKCCQTCFSWHSLHNWLNVITVQIESRI